MTTLTRVLPMLVDEITVPSGSDANTATKMIHELEFDPDSFDYKLWTDGSGHIDGYGAAAAIWKHQDGDTDTVFSGNYGQTVNRNELTAMLDGLTNLLAHYSVWASKRLELPPGDVLRGLVDGNRATVAWYTDRQNLACSLIWQDSGYTVHRRNCDRDLWVRASFLMRHLCVVPYYVPRNVIPQQAACDKICDSLRVAAKGADGAIKLHTLGFDLPWTTKSQKASL